MSIMKEENIFSKELIAFIEEWKEKPGNLIMVLHRVQEEFGFISRESADKVALMLDMPLATIYGVLSFYHFFKMVKPGEHNIQICLGTACYLKGGDALVDELTNLLGIELGGVTEDGKFSLEGVRCVGCCGLAPVISIGGEVFGKVTKDQLPGIISKYN
ncbi:MAG: NAD(P)H-dependent oxidoreductase subunit E [Sphaerochaetaceae bacterium]|nr:NAD(P)H-dependent oxidoreductase subunit E [Sphaerochaetaceae bacterium]MDD3366459.1 NAD(P)H-dependent oxidoreductase subunit E [Sphaerochaetaceae bacterium]MDD4219562.1 NAD(P)H-dependent oxidoreductase subunit E [Sphaerochaetaceae bacterium]MDY0372245.1 NAD(P)H-dependent oxidoreductase subunit E [Sphaerochaetaceae bacterium]